MPSGSPRRTLDSVRCMPAGWTLAPRDSEAVGNALAWAVGDVDVGRGSLQGRGPVRERLRLLSRRSARARALDVLVASATGEPNEGEQRAEASRARPSAGE